MLLTITQISTQTHAINIEINSSERYIDDLKNRLNENNDEIILRKYKIKELKTIRLVHRKYKDSSISDADIVRILDNWNDKHLQPCISSYYNDIKYFREITEARMHDIETTISHIEKLKSRKQKAIGVKSFDVDNSISRILKIPEVKNATWSINNDVLTILIDLNPIVIKSTNHDRSLDIIQANYQIDTNT